ncbi:MAG: hypothetical protein IGS39_11000 [Calothrix sp. C42_A2020_038]|nr:hypothetical protein [Calothrix sp. C42_A2020_038]
MSEEDLRQFIFANARAIDELRASTSELRASTSELRASTNELRASTNELRASTKELTQSVGDLRASISDLRDIVVGHERRIIRLEGKEVDWWGDHLTLIDRVQKLEEWKRKMEGENQ